MKNRILGLALGLGVMLSVPALAATDARLESAINHVRSAITQGKLKYASTLAMHADLALEDAQAVEKANPNPHTSEAIVHLKAAIEEGNKNNAEAATKHAEEAFKHLEEAEKAK